MGIDFGGLRRQLFYVGARAAAQNAGSPMYPQFGHKPPHPALGRTKPDPHFSPAKPVGASPSPSYFSLGDYLRGSKIFQGKIFDTLNLIRFDRRQEFRYFQR